MAHRIPLQAKRSKKYGAEILNNIGTPPMLCSNRATFFIIYLFGAMEDYRSLNYNWHIPYRETKQRSSEQKEQIIQDNLTQRKETAVRNLDLPKEEASGNTPQ